MGSNIIDTSSSKTIFSNTKINIVETKNNEVILSDSDVREVIKKGYLLSQINLAEIPDIIKDAINQAIIDAKNQTLSDSLIQTLKDSLDNLDSGVYKKTYIDNTISYIESIALSKVDSSTLAGIISNQITYAIQNLATTSQVQTLNSRIGDSEAEITTVKNTINTKDQARANQITEFEASINDTFAKYSEAIDLTIDAQGNAKSQKIETLTTNIGLQIQELTELVNSGSGWEASTLKLITNPSGGITGYSFYDGSGLKSNFEINADNFKISNAYNTYTPFTISGTSLYFNGKVNFLNVTGTDNVVTTTNMQTAFNSNITSINGGKIDTNSISANKIASYNITASNTTFGSSIIGNAQIQDGSINNAKIANASIDNAKIANASITNAKISDLSVSTFKIQDEAVVVPRFATGSGSCQIVYTPTVSHNVVIFFLGGSLSNGQINREFKINGTRNFIYYQNVYNHLGEYSNMIQLNLTAGVTYNFQFLSYYNSDYWTTCSMTMLGVKK